MKPNVIIIWTLFFLLNIVLPISIAAQSGSEAISYGNNKNAGNFITVNGIKLYYEIYGGELEELKDDIIYPEIKNYELKRGVTDLDTKFTYVFRLQAKR